MSGSFLSVEDKKEPLILGFLFLEGLAKTSSGSLHPLSSSFGSPSHLHVIPNLPDLHSPEL